MKEYLNEFYLPFPQSFTYSQDIDYYLYEEYTKELENVWLEGRQLFRDYCLQFAEQIIFSRKNNVHIAALYSPGIPEPVDLSCDRKPNLLAAHNITQLPLDLQEVSLEFQSITLYQEYPKLMLKKKKRLCHKIKLSLVVHRDKHPQICPAILIFRSSYKDKTPSQKKSESESHSVVSDCL